MFVCFLVLDCPNGTYGLNCATQCSCLNGASCSPVTGVCNCTAGYYGTNCSIGKTLCDWCRYVRVAVTVLVCVMVSFR